VGTHLAPPLVSCLSPQQPLAHSLSLRRIMKLSLAVALAPFASALWPAHLKTEEANARSQLSEAHAEAAGDAVFVTPLLDAGNITGAQAISRMTVPGWTEKSGQEMHAGFLTIDSATASNTYFSFAKALNGDENAPVLLWLQGGPGASSLFGMFTEIGSFNVDSAFNIVPREVSWNQDHHLLYLDNPIGTGFSFTNSLEAMATNQVSPPSSKRSVSRRRWLLSCPVMCRVRCRVFCVMCACAVPTCAVPT
jgi:carboxypeptidase C (cathepsin A)